MNFFGNLWNNIKGAASSVGSFIGSAASSVGSALMAPINGVNNVANAISSGILNNGSNQPYKSVPGVDSKTGQPNMTYNIPSLAQKTTPQGTMYYDNQGRQVALNNLGQTDVVKTLNNNVKTQQYQTALGISGGSNLYDSVRPMITTTANGTTITPNYNRNFGNEPYYDAASKSYITPLQGYSGSSGTTSGQSFNSSAMTPTTGAPGLAGGSSYTGTLGATGLGASSPFSGLTQTDEEKKRDEVRNKILNIGKTGGATPVPGITPTTGGVTTPAMISPYFAPTSVAAPQRTPAPLQTPNVAASTNVEQLTTPPSTALNTSYYNSPNDVAVTNEAINNNFQAERQKLDQQYPTDKGPLTTDTPEQLQFIQQSEDAFGIKAAMDEYKRSNTQLAEFEKQRLDVMKDIQALNSAYKPIIEDIKNNPDLPKGLAARRLTDLNEKQKDVLLGFQNQLALVNQSIEDQNQAVNRNFNIVQFSQTQAERAQDNQRALLQLMVSSGAIGGMTDRELSQLASTTGMTLSGLQKARSTANDPSKNIITETDDNGTVRGIDKSSGKVVWTVSSAGKSNASTTGGGSGDSVYSQGLVQNILERRVSYNDLTAGDKKIVNNALASQGLLVPRPLTAKEKDAQNDASSGLVAVQQLRSMYASNGLPLSADKLTPELWGLGTAVGSAVDSRLSQFRLAANEATDIKTRIRTGAALNESEISFYASQRPALGDRPADIEKKLSNLEAFYLGMSGLPVVVTNPKTGQSFAAQDMYDPKQRLDVRQAINAGWKVTY